MFTTETTEDAEKREKRREKDFKVGKYPGIPIQISLFLLSSFPLCSLWSPW
jgi:hypothetical protein